MVEETVVARGNLLGRFVPARYILAVLGSIGMAIIYGLKVNLSVAMVAMLNHTAIELAAEKTKEVVLIGNGTIMNNATAFITTTVSTIIEMSTMDGGVDDGDSCVAVKNNGSANDQQNGPFNWSEPLQGTILSCYFWGYFVSQIPGARIAEKFSAKYVMLFSVIINIICTILSPVMANLHYGAMILMRILEGIGGGVTFPSMHIMLASWAPPNERSVLSAIVYAGTALGTVISMLMAGILAGTLGWESVFYVMGGLSCIWVVLWTICIQDTPSKQPFIDMEERNMIVNGINAGGDDPGHGSSKKAPIPLKKILTSGPFLAILIAHTCSNWGWYMLLIELPFYMKQVLLFNIKENAIVTAVPFLTMWFFSMILSKTLDIMRTKGFITTTVARKIATLFASVVPMFCLLALCYIGCKRTLAVILMGIGITSIGGMFCGFLSNHIDISPNYAGTLMAFTNTAATLPGIIVPVFVGQITHGNQTIEAWRIIFFVTIALYIVEILAYTILGSGEEQPWNKGASTYDFRSTMENGDGAEATPLNVRDSQNKYTKNLDD